MAYSHHTETTTLHDNVEHRPIECPQLDVRGPDDG